MLQSLDKWTSFIEQMKEAGFDCSEDMSQKLSPLLSEHINFVGKYTFCYHEKQKDGSFRSLNFKNR
nr:transposase [Listeria sp. ILCC797]